MAKAFLSHSSHDKDFVERIALQLGKNNCHYDKFTFEAGNKTLDEILAALNDTDIFVLFISNKALESKWVRTELVEAHKKLSDAKILKIFPLIIDDSIRYDDPRIPQWLWKPYNIHTLTNHVVVLQKIKQFLREVNLGSSRHNAELAELFVGRNEEMAQLERELVRIDNSKPSCIIMTGVFEGIGRRTLLRNGLVKTRIIKKNEFPFFISLGNKESVENLILALNQLDPKDEIFKKDLSLETLESKIEIAKMLIATFSTNGIIINILDEGSIVLPNNSITDWFVKILDDKRFQNQVTVCLISRFKPRNQILDKMSTFVHFNVPPLSKDDTRTLFIQYSDILQMQIEAETSRFFLTHLSGIPAQVIHCVNLIKKSGIDLAKKNINDIDDFAELRVLSVLENFKDDKLCIQLLILLSRFEVFSFDLLNKIVPDQKKLYDAMEKLFMFSIFDLLGSAKELIRLNSSIADYVRRSRIKLNDEFNKKLNAIIKEVLSKEVDLSSGTDYAEFLIGIQELINQGRSVPSRYFIPSFMLKMLIQKYNQGDYDGAITLAKQVLDNQQRYDQQVIREVRNWLCLSFARTKDPQFYETVKFFESEHKDYNFLLGFNQRNLREFDKAEEYYKKVLQRDSDHSRTKRELVLVYLAKNRYADAVELAESNYKKFRTNPFHIQAYFTCLVKKKNLNDTEKQTLIGLISAISRSLDTRAKDFERTMEAEYKLYVDNDVQAGIALMQEAAKLCTNKYYSKRALYEMYIRQGMLEEAKLILKDIDYNNMDQLG